MEKRNIQFSPPDITENEIQAVIDILNSGWITTGPKTKLFEQRIAEYCGTNRAVCLNSATACLESILRLLGIGEGDEVITSAYTYTATASPVCHVGAKLVLVDTQKNGYEMNYEKLEEAINEHTKAVIAVDLGGVLCDYNRIFEIVEAKKKKFAPKNILQEKLGRIAVISDGAHAFGASQYEKMAGEIADFTSFSFHAVKNLTTAEGGALTWNPGIGFDDEQMYREFMLYSLHGQSKDALAKTSLGAWEYDVLVPGYKSNMTDLAAGIGLAQLDRYPSLLQKRREIITKYNRSFKDTPIQYIDHYTECGTSSGHLYLTRIHGISLEKRNKIIVELAERDIAVNVHYKPLPMLTAYKNMGFNINEFPNAYAQYENEITLPLHTCLSEEDLEYIIENFSELVR